MSSWVRPCLAAVAGCLLAGSAGAQLLPGVSLPLPLPPVGNVPVVGPVVQNVLGQPQPQQAIRPTLDTVSGLPESVAKAGAPTLLELRRLRLQALIRDNRALLEADDRGEPVLRGILVALDPDPLSLRLAAGRGFRVIGNSNDTNLGLFTLTIRQAAMAALGQAAAGTPDAVAARVIRIG